MLVAPLAQKVLFEREMASNPATPFGIEFGHVDDLHRRPRGPASEGGERSHRAPRAHRNLGVISPGSEAHAVSQASPLTSPFARLTARNGRPLRVGIVSDFVRIPYANGAAFQTRFLYQELRRCGHEVTVIGPHDPLAKEEDLPPGSISLPSLPLHTYPGLRVPLPLESWVADSSRFDFDLLYAPVTSMILDFAVWLRKMKGIPLVCVNTTHLAAAYEVMLPEKLARMRAVHVGLHAALRKPQERIFASAYNDSDGLVVLSEGLRDYWRERGVTVPIHVIPRTVQPEMFDRPLGADPYVHLQGRPHGARLLCAGRHTREKAQDRMIRIFARHVARTDAACTLTMLGIGPETTYFKRVAEEEGVADRVFFPGEASFSQMADYYAYADLFVHASLSETFGNVMSEALWCGTPTVAFADGMGTSAQIKDGVNGVLLSPGTDGATHQDEANRAFGRAVLELIADPQERARLGKAASRIARERSSPLAVKARMADAFRAAQDHASACGLKAAALGPRPLRWLTTFNHFRRWGAVNGGVYLAGHLRPGVKFEKNTHPQIAGK